MHGLVSWAELLRCRRSMVLPKSLYESLPYLYIASALGVVVLVEPYEVPELPLAEEPLR